jgi:WD40 repeat protein
MKSPFKFLDSYTKEDREIYFGREREIDELYRRLFESKILLVYGESGTGKSSLVNCGLMSKFRDSDCLPVYVRRSENMLESFSLAIQDAFTKPFSYQLLTALLFKKALRELSTETGKPVFFVFDQFEELFIFGTKEEKQSMLQVVKVLVESDIDCRFIFIIREEYFASIAEFEKHIPNFLSNRMRIERMDHANALTAIKGTCNIFSIKVEEGFAEALLRKLNPESPGVELTYLQIFLDKIFNLAVSGAKVGEKENVPILFTLRLLENVGGVSDLLERFLDEQISLLPNPEAALAILKSFVSFKGTKRQLNLADVKDYTYTLGEHVKGKELLEILGTLVHLRILRDKNEKGFYELRHDTLAAKIFEKVSAAEIEILEVRQFIENAYYFWKKHGVLLSPDDLKYINRFENKLSLSEELTSLISVSRETVNRTRTQKRNIFLSSGIAIILVLLCISIWALSERYRARILNTKLLAEKYNYLATILSSTDPTKGLRLAEYAFSLDTSNYSIKRNILAIYSENSLYSVISKHSNPIYAVAISPDNTKILTGSQDGSARLMDMKGDLITTFNGHTGDIISVAFSPDGQKIVTSSLDGTARLWDISGNQLLSLTGHKSVITSTAFSPNGKYILTGSWDRTARLWDLLGSTLQILKGHTNELTSVVFSPDGSKILTGSRDMTARLWNLKGKELTIFKGHIHNVNSVAFSPDGQTIVTASQDRTAVLWDLSGKAEKVFRCKNGVQSIAFSQDGQMILTGTDAGSVQLWNLDGDVIEDFMGHTNGVGSVIFTSDGRKIITAAGDKTIRMWDLPETSITLFKGHTNSVTCIDYSASRQQIITGSIDRTVKLWDLKGKLINTFRCSDDARISTVAFSPDGNEFLTGSWDNSVKLWDLNGKKLKEFNGHTGRVLSVAFSPDMKMVVSGGQDNTFRLWNMEDNSSKTFQYNNMISSVAFSPDGKMFATASYDNTAHLWDLNGNSLAIFLGHSAPLESVRFSPDGTKILTGATDQSARLWDLKGNLLRVFNGHLNDVHTVAFSPDGKFILTGSEDRTVRLWDLQGKTIQIFKSAEGSISQVLFFSDGQKIMTASFDKVARIYPVKPSYNEFKKTDYYEKMNAGDKLRYGIYQFNDAKRSDNEKDLLLAADYYSDLGTEQTGEEKIESFDNALELYKMRSAKYPETKKTFGNLRTLCGNYILQKEYKKALVGLQICWVADSTNLWTIGYVSVTYTLNNQYDRGMQILKRWKTETGYKSSGENTGSNDFLAWINLLENMGISHPDFAKARELLMQK